MRISGFLGRFIDSLAANTSEVACFLHTPLPAERSLMDYSISSENVRLVDLGPHVSIPRRMLYTGRIRQIIKDHSDRLDALLIRTPTPLLSSVAKAASNMPLVLLLIGDYVKTIPEIRQPLWRKQAVKLWMHWNKRQWLKVAQDSLTISASRELYEELEGVVPALTETRSTTLRRSDLYLREDVCFAPPYRILYTGRLDPAKGLFELLEAVALLTHQGEDVVLDLVGWAPPDDQTPSRLIAQAEARGLGERVKLHGYKSIGSELFEFYKKADFFVLAPPKSEAFSRSIWEALGHSVPVIATTIGSIPLFLKDRETARLIQPGNPRALAEAIHELIHDASLRRKIIAGGIELVRTNTLDYQTPKMIKEIESWVDRCRSGDANGAARAKSL